MTDTLVSPLWVQSLGWTLLHFLWQGTAIAVLYALVRRALERELSAEGRYVLAWFALGSMGAAPPLTFLLVATADRGGAPAWWDASIAGWERVLAGMVVVWLLGVAVFSVRLAAGWTFAFRLRASSDPAPPEWQRVVQRTAARVGATRPVRLLVSSLVEVPVVIGWLKPAILVPIGSLTGLPIEHMTALLAHELGHIRRQDFLASILQRVVESLLFYHPAVWWVSHHIRTERELCCDELAVQASGDAVTYARALAELESQRGPRLNLAAAANGGALVKRIRRLLEPSQEADESFPGAGPAWAMSLLWIAGSGVAIAHAAQTAATVVNHDPFHILKAAPEAILYNPFLPSPEALMRKYGKPHTVMPNGSDPWRLLPGGLEDKLGNVGHLGAEGLRENATYAPLPRYPQRLLRAGNEGLVVVEVAVSAAGTPLESLVMVSFDREAAEAVTAALNQWRFCSMAEFPKVFKNGRDCGDCIRVGRLGFEFRIEKGKGRVVDLAEAENKRLRRPNPFLKAKR